MSGSQIVILGAGPIGTGFAAVFAAAGARVTLVEPDAARRAAAPEAVERGFSEMQAAGRPVTRGVPVEVGADGLASADMVLDCGPEDLTVKRALFAQMLAGAPAAVLATASSAIPVSQLVAPADQARCLVAHPVNPPTVLRLLELVPAPGTDPATVARAKDIFAAAGFRPVVLGHEIEGFVLNRLQGAVLREAYRLVAEGVIGPADLDRVMTDGLGPRWALSGPFETAALNAGGLAAHAARMGPAYARMGRARGEVDVDWPSALVAKAAGVVPDAQLAERAAWRAQAVARVVRLREELAGEWSRDHDT